MLETLQVVTAVVHINTRDSGLLAHRGARQGVLSPWGMSNNSNKQERGLTRKHKALESA